jgi:S-adenosylmethionine decarboxylase
VSGRIIRTYKLILTNWLRGAIETMSDYWGYHLMLNCRRCVLDKIVDAENVANFARELVKRIDMQAYGEPQVVNFGTGNKAGFTLVQLIQTSNICAHFCNETGDVYLDVFSCKEFDIMTVKDTVREFFEPEHIGANYVERQA